MDPWVRKIPWRREWQPTPVFLPKEPYGQRNLEGYSLQDQKESDMTKHLSTGLLKLEYLSEDTIQMLWPILMDGL